jgi:hypothetical protein
MPHFAMIRRAKILPKMTETSTAAIHAQITDGPLNEVGRQVSIFLEVTDLPVLRGVVEKLERKAAFTEGEHNGTHA